MPIILEIIMRGVAINLVSVILRLAWAFVAEGELAAMAWLPAIVVLTWTNCDGPVSLPPKIDTYIPKRFRPHSSYWLTDKAWARIMPQCDTSLHGTWGI
jgi:hypothetical protein